MERSTLISIIAVVVTAIIVGAIYTTNNDSHKTNNSTIKTNETSHRVINACEVFSLTEAKKVLGDGAKVSGSSGKADNENENIKLTNCLYSIGSSPMTTASLLARSAKTDYGVNSNKAAFTTDKPAGVQDVTGYGESAYFDQSLGQLDVLKNGTWYIFSYIQGVDPKSTSLDQLKKVADTVMVNAK